MSEWIDIYDRQPEMGPIVEAANFDKTVKVLARAASSCADRGGTLWDVWVINNDLGESKEVKAREFPYWRPYCVQGHNIVEKDKG